jgi:hypothetical protein
MMETLMLEGENAGAIRKDSPQARGKKTLHFLG